MNTPVKYVAALTGVREASLLGMADLRYWSDVLAKEGLCPAERDGAAQVMVIAAAARFRGIRFREVSFSILVKRPVEVAGNDAAYLVEAFNSRGLFALSERVFFSTPYRHADIAFSVATPVVIEVRRRGSVVFAARAGQGLSTPGRADGQNAWEGPVFLPGRRRRYFVARIRGNTRRYPFADGEDSLTIAPSQTQDVFRALRDSGFIAREWAIREDAAHAKSKTYVRPPIAQGPPA